MGGRPASQARARKPRRRASEAEQSREHTVAVNWDPYSYYCNLHSTHDSTTSLPSHSLSLCHPPPRPVPSSDPTLTSQRRHLPAASPWRRILLFVLPASSSCTTHPRRQPVLERRFVQPLLQLIIIIASVNRLVRSLRREFKNTPSNQTSAHVSRTFLDLSTARSLSSLQPSYLPSTRSRTPSPRRGTCDRFTHAKQVLKRRTSRTGAQA